MSSSCIEYKGKLLFCYIAHFLFIFLTIFMIVCLSFCLFLLLQWRLRTLVGLYREQGVWKTGYNIRNLISIDTGPG